MPRFRKKPVIVEAMQLAGTPAGFMDVYLWVERETQGSYNPLDKERPASGVSIDPETGFMLIMTLEGEMQAKPGWWIIKGVNGEFYPCNSDVFEKSYELIDEDLAAAVAAIDAADEDD